MEEVYSSVLIRPRWQGVTQEELDNAGRIHKNAYIGSITALFIICWIAALVRFYIRIVMQRIFSLDDVFLLLGMGCITTTVGILWTMINETYTAAGYLGGKGITLALQPGYLDLVFQYMKDNNIILMVAWTGICCVKLSFLFLFRKLIDRITYMMVYWWLVLLYILAVSGYGLAVYILVCPYFFTLQAVQCVTGPGLQKILAYSISQITLDVLGDILILVIPIRIIYKVNVDIKQKFALVLSLCLTVVMIVVTIIRGAGMLDHGQFDSVWDGYWNIVSAEVGLTMTSATAFRAFYTSRNKSSAAGQAESQGSSRADPQPGLLAFWWNRIRHPFHVQEMKNWPPPKVLSTGYSSNDTNHTNTNTNTNSNINTYGRHSWDLGCAHPAVLSKRASTCTAPLQPLPLHAGHKAPFNTVFANDDDDDDDDDDYGTGYDNGNRDGRPGRPGKGWFGQCPWEVHPPSLLPLAAARHPLPPPPVGRPPTAVFDGGGIGGAIGVDEDEIDDNTHNRNTGRWSTRTGRADIEGYPG